MENSIHLKHGTIYIATTQKYQHLGLTLTTSRNFNVPTFSKKINKVSSRIRTLRKIRSFMDAKKNRTNTPILNFSLFLLMDNYRSVAQLQTYIEHQIEKIETRAQIIIGSSETMPKTETIKKKHLCTFVHRFLHSEDTLNEFKHYFKIRTINVNKRCNETKIEIPKRRREATGKSTYYQGTIIFNELLIDIRKVVDLKLLTKLN